VSEMPPGAAAAQRRPLVITIICVLGFLGALVTIPLIFSPTARAIGEWYEPTLAAAALVGLVCMIGLWLMRRWAVYVYTAMCVINQAVLLKMGVWNPLTLIIPAVVIVVMFVYLRRMR
jgi:hypothetical protein